MQLIPDTIDLSEYMNDEPAEHRVLPAGNWVNDVADYFHKPDTAPKIRLPWKKTHYDFHFRTHELTMWAGINGHGKSQIVGHVMQHLAEKGERIAIASLEMRPVSTMARMTRQAYGADYPPIDYCKKFGEWTNDRIWLYDHVGSCNTRTMLAVIRYSIDKFGVKHFVVDNLMKCGLGEDDYNGQKLFIDSLSAIAKDTGCHIHLVLHIKKGKTENDVPGKFDIKGSGAITDLADNVFIVWRNKAKEAAIRAGDDYSPDDPDALLILDKQRHGETEGRYRLFFDRSSLQYLEERNDIPKHCKAETGINYEEVEF